MSDSPILTNAGKLREEYRNMIDKTVDAVLSSFSDKSAFSGIDPYTLRKNIGALGLIDEKGLGFDETLRMTRNEIMPHLLRTWSTSYMPHLHSPATLESIAAELIIATFNNSMDSWDQSPAATEVEVSVIRNLARLFGYGENADGCFTSGGSQSNFSAITAIRDAFLKKQYGWDAKKHGLISDFAKLRLYTSEISHFSMDKSCHMLGLGYDAVRKIPVDARCRVDLDEFERMVGSDVRSGLIPFCAVATIGTTDFGSIDDVAGMKRICDKYSMFLHADAAYGSGLILSRKHRDRIGNLSLCDSITVDFHKMFLLPISCSAVLVKDSSLLECFELHADYLNREEDEEDGYINLVGKSMQTTRRFDALKVFMAFKSRGFEGFSKIIDTAVDNAAYFYSRLRKDSSFEAPVEPEISSVVFRLDAEDNVNRRIRRSLMEKGIVIGQTVMGGKVMLKFTLLNPNLTHDHIDKLIEMIKKEGGAV